MNNTYPYERTVGQIWGRRVIWGFLLTIVLLTAVQLVVQYLTTGTLQVNANGGSISVVNNTSLTTVGHGESAVGLRVHTGTYTVRSTHGPTVSARVVKVSAHKTTRVDLDLVPVSGVEPVSDTTAQNIRANNTVLYFLNSNGQLCSIDSQNNQRVVAETPTFELVKWADTGYGAGITSDGVLYEISGGIIKPLSLGIGRVTAFAVAPNHQLYVAKDRSVYRIVNGEAQELVTLPATLGLLVASNNSVVATTALNTEGSKINPSLVLARVGSKVIRKNLNVTSLAISPDGGLLVVGGPGNNQRLLINDSLNIVKHLPSSPSFTSPTWLNRKVLLYGVNGQLWRYDVAEGAASVLANTPLAGLITEITPSDEGTFVYLGVQNIAGSPVIKRVSIDGSPVPELLSKLQAVMPYSTDDYFMTLTNFSSPVVFVAPFPPLTNSSAGYVQEASTYLKQIGINSSGIEVRYISR